LQGARPLLGGLGLLPSVRTQLQPLADVRSSLGCRICRSAPNQFCALNLAGTNHHDIEWLNVLVAINFFVINDKIAKTDSMNNLGLIGGILCKHVEVTLSDRVGANHERVSVQVTMPTVECK
jgi:hypothetical protein